MTMIHAEICTAHVQTHICGCRLYLPLFLQQQQVMQTNIFSSLSRNPNKKIYFGDRVDTSGCLSCVQKDEYHVDF